jgi:hypothetical protein
MKYFLKCSKLRMYTNYLVPGPGTTSGTLLALLSAIDGLLLLPTFAANHAAAGGGGGDFLKTTILAMTMTTTTTAFSAG